MFQDTSLACEQAPSEVGKKFGERSEWDRVRAKKIRRSKRVGVRASRRDSASEASGALPPHQTALRSSRLP